MREVNREGFGSTPDHILQRDKAVGATGVLAWERTVLTRLIEDHGKEAAMTDWEVVMGRVPSGSSPEGLVTGVEGCKGL